MAKPGTNTTIGGSLGKIDAVEDGNSILVLSGVAVGGKFALGDVLGPFLELGDAELMGIDEAYDTTNTTIAWKHIKDFYVEAPKGTKLWVMVVAMTQTLTVTATAATANGYKKAVDFVEGNAPLVGLTFTPDGSYTPTYDGQLEADLLTALAQIKITAEAHRLTKDPYRVIVEGRNFQGTPASLTNYRASGTTPGVNRAMVVIGNDYAYGEGAGYKSKYASVGAALGRAAANKVNRNIGRVKSGSLSSITTGGLSNGAKISTITDTQQGLISDYGYVFMLKHKRKSGFFFNDDHMACVSTDTYGQLTNGRTVDKIDKIVHATNIEEILDEVEVDPATGQLDATTAKHYESLLEDAVNDQMGGSNKEISGLKAFVDPAQNIISLSALVEKLTTVPTGTLRQINTTIELAASLD
ncbi:DUF2586 family protein [Aurantibacillus circumpalustris]|uniref:DUF2586 family protein n=1 Tax=Aurantibacillus circumpalustris TaxID=3036359 RepID=UPI00295B5A0D|nr:DUF2586 family protein [Aurantibacillus circumpalustris]